VTAARTIPPRLVADIGGTHARFALQEPGARAGEPVVLKVADYADIESATAEALRRLAPARPPEAAAFAVAAPVTGDAIAMTNHPWRFSRERFAQRFGLGLFEVVNDFAAIAIALPRLGREEKRRLGADAPEEGAPRATLAAIGPGTGLGTAGLVPAGGGWAVVAGEGGHVDFAPGTARERLVYDHIAARHSHVSLERVLSGPGLVAIYRALAEADGRGEEDLPETPSEIAARAQRGADQTAVEAAALFSAALGAAAGNLALTLGARGGVYVAGGVVPGLGAAFDEGAFRRRFEAKGRFGDYLARIPTHLIVARWPALLGLAALLDAALAARR